MGTVCGTDPKLGTDDSEHTIGFDMRHSHLGTFMGISDPEAIELAMADVRGIITEQSVIVVVHRGGKWAGSSLEDASDTITAIPGATRVYSWRGTQDRLV